MGGHSGRVPWVPRIVLGRGRPRTAPERHISHGRHPVLEEAHGHDATLSHRAVRTLCCRLHRSLDAEPSRTVSVFTRFM